MIDKSRLRRFKAGHCRRNKIYWFHGIWMYTSIDCREESRRCKHSIETGVLFPHKQYSKWIIWCLRLRRTIDTSQLNNNAYAIIFLEKSRRFISQLQWQMHCRQNQDIRRLRYTFLWCAWTISTLRLPIFNFVERDSRQSINSPRTWIIVNRLYITSNKTRWRFAKMIIWQIPCHWTSINIVV